jgi:glycerophosphoryl diester phosphodiesterase
MVRLFSHRGFTSEVFLQNSIKSLKNAHEFGFRAIEFDIWFLNQKLILKHDAPQKNELETLPDFSDYLIFKNDFIYWLDFKNLDEKNVADALKLVKKKLDKAGVNLDQSYFAPFITDYKIAEKILAEIRKIFGEKVRFIAVCEELENEIAIKNLRNFLTKNNIKFLSIFHKLIDEKFLKLFPDIEIFAWTVNDVKRLQELERLGVANFATDKITPETYEKSSTFRA